MFATQRDVQQYRETHSVRDLLSAAEYAFFTKIAVQKRKDTWLLGRFCAKKLVQTYWRTYKRTNLDLNTIQLPALPQQKPRLQINNKDHHTIDISLSHTDQVAVSALNILPHTLVGVDIEGIKHSNDTFCNYFLSPNELQFMKSNVHERDTLSTAYWSLKEATLKALGIGLNGSMKGVAVNLTNSAPGIHISKQNIHLSSINKPNTITADYGMIGEYAVAVVFLNY